MTSFTVGGQSVTQLRRRKLLQANSSLEVQYIVKAFLLPGHAENYSFGDHVTATFQTKAVEFQQSLSYASSFFPPPPNSVDSATSKNQSTTRNSRRAAIYVSVGGTILFFILLYIGRTVCARRQHPNLDEECATEQFTEEPSEAVEVSEVVERALNTNRHVVDTSSSAFLDDSHPISSAGETSTLSESSGSTSDSGSGSTSYASYLSNSTITSQTDLDKNQNNEASISTQGDPVNSIDSTFRVTNLQKDEAVITIADRKTVETRLIENPLAGATGGRPPLPVKTGAQVYEASNISENPHQERQFVFTFSEQHSDYSSSYDDSAPGVSHALSNLSPDRYIPFTYSVEFSASQKDK